MGKKAAKKNVQTSAKSSIPDSPEVESSPTPSIVEHTDLGEDPAEPPPVVEHTNLEEDPGPSVVKHTDLEKNLLTPAVKHTNLEEDREPVIIEDADLEEDYEPPAWQVTAPYLSPIVCARIGSSKQEFNFHSLVLIKSPILYEKCQNWLEHQTDFHLEEVDPAVFELVLCYLYGGSYEGYFSPSNPKPRKADAKPEALKRHSLVYSFAENYQLSRLASLTTKNIRNIGRIEYQAVLSVATLVYEGLPGDDTWFRGYFREQTRTALIENHALGRETWILDIIKEGSRILTVDLFNVFVQGYESGLATATPRTEEHGSPIVEAEAEKPGACPTEKVEACVLEEPDVNPTEDVEVCIVEKPEVYPAEKVEACGQEEPVETEDPVPDDSEACPAEEMEANEPEACAAETSGEDRDMTSPTDDGGLQEQGQNKPDSPSPSPVEERFRGHFEDHATTSSPPRELHTLEDEEAVPRPSDGTTHCPRQNHHLSKESRWMRCEVCRKYVYVFPETARGQIGTPPGDRDQAQDDGGSSNGESVSSKVGVC